MNPEWNITTCRASLSDGGIISGESVWGGSVPLESFWLMRWRANANCSLVSFPMSQISQSSLYKHKRTHYNLNWYNLRNISQNRDRSVPWAFMENQIHGQATHQMCAKVADGKPVFRNMSLTSAPDTKPSLSLSVLVNNSSYLALSEGDTTHCIHTDRQTVY